MKDVTAKLLKAKEELGYSYADIARITGLPKSSIQRFLTGTTGKFPLNYLQPICDALHVRAADVAGWSEPLVVSATIDKPIPGLSTEEQLLIKAYRGARADRQVIAMEILTNHKKE